MGRDRDPVPRDSGLWPARISRGFAGQRTGDTACQMEDNGAARGHRLSDCRQAGGSGCADCQRDRVGPAVGFGNCDALHRMGLLPCRDAALDRGIKRVKVLYFAWVRERIGKTEEDLEPPAEVHTVAELMV